jgi:hypothetical protein
MVKSRCLFAVGIRLYFQQDGFIEIGEIRIAPAISASIPDQYWTDACARRRDDESGGHPESGCYTVTSERET